MRFLLVLALSGIGACVPAPELPPPGAGRAARVRRIAIEGRKAFARRCAPCHGEDGTGNGRFLATGLSPRPPDLTDPVFLRARSDADLDRALRGGSAALGRSALCPPWGETLDEDTLRALVAHLGSLRRKEVEE